MFAVSKENMGAAHGLTIALPLASTATHHHPPRRVSCSSSQISADPGWSNKSMAIPGARMEDVPPALPPPRYINDLDRGYDLAWNWENEDLMTGKSKLAPIKPGSSLLGGSRQSQLLPDDDEEIVDVRLGIKHSQSSLRAAATPSWSPFATDASTSSSSKGPPSSSGINQRSDRLQGENPLARQNHHQHTHAYDKHLLLKIGKSNSPPGHSRTGPRERTAPAQKLSIQTRDSSASLRLMSNSSAATNPAAQWMAGSTPIASPTFTGSSRDYNVDSCSPSYNVNSHSFGSDHGFFLGTNMSTTQSFSRSGHSPNHEGSRSRSERGSYDSAIYATNVDYANDETSLGGLFIEERPLLGPTHGIKRRALSPPIDGSSTRTEPKSAAQNILPRQPYRAESLSSTASSAQHHSFASSNLSSFAPSSMTSLSSAHNPTTHEYSHLLPPSHVPQIVHKATTAVLPLKQSIDTPVSTMSGQPLTANARALPTRIGNHFICSCCPKKAKKFDTEEQLRNHENEKQYTCTYCNNRFKNKNEAERHQNSLHLRRQSWSCAAITTYDAAFHPSSFSNPRNTTTDTCGFCGMEFNKQPPNWEERIDHLSSAHKFGECHTAKKFFRADHFRQHLKHSHAGKSGKWTNILENSCQREEASSEPASLSPTASEHSQSGLRSRSQGNLVIPPDAVMGGVETIDEVYEEA